MVKGKIDRDVNQIHSTDQEDISKFSQLSYTFYTRTRYTADDKRYT